MSGTHCWHTGKLFTVSTISEKWEEVGHHLLVVDAGAVEVDQKLDAEVGHQIADQTPASHQVHHQLVVTEKETDAADPLHNLVDPPMIDTSIVTSTIVADQGLGLPETNIGINTGLDLPRTNTGINTGRGRVPRWDITRNELATNQRGGQCHHLVVVGFLHHRKIETGTKIIHRGNQIKNHSSVIAMKNDHPTEY